MVYLFCVLSAHFAGIVYDSNCGFGGPKEKVKCLLKPPPLEKNTNHDHKRNGTKCEHNLS